eukprot:1156505-Amphidinium_carterae.1
MHWRCKTRGLVEVERFNDVRSRCFEVFLRGQTTKSGLQLSPVQVVKEPDGSLSRAATMQTALSKDCGAVHPTL